MNQIKEFWNVYVEVLKTKYFKFDGRARRKEFWSFILVNFIIAAILSAIDQALFSKEILGYVYSLAVALPILGLWVRRLHDTNKTGWLVLLNFIPVIGQIILLVWAAKVGDTGENQYGADPKATV